MFRPTGLARVGIHAANVLVILFFLLPIFAVAIGSVQSEKSLQADTRSILPPEYTFDNLDRKSVV